MSDSNIPENVEEPTQAPNEQIDEIVVTANRIPAAGFDIGQFRAELYLNGILKNNRFLLYFMPPASMNNWYATSNSTGNLDPESLEEDRAEGKNDVRFLTTRCDAATIPGVNFFTTDNIRRYGYGQLERRPYLPTFNPITISFVVDRNAAVIKYFTEWQQRIVNYDRTGVSGIRNPNTPYFLSYKDDYICERMQIYLYDEKTQKVVTVNLHEVYPLSSTDLNLTWDEASGPLRFSVTLQYTDFAIEFAKGPGLTGTEIVQAGNRLSKRPSLGSKIGDMVEGAIYSGVEKVFKKIF